MAGRDPMEVDKIETRRIKVVQRIRRGWSYTMIAEELGVTPSTIRSDWQAVIKEWHEARDTDVKWIVAQKLEEYAEVKREAWEQWERSKQDKRKLVRESWGVNGDKPRENLIRTREGRLGDNAYLRTVLHCLQAERELMALDPSRKVEETISIVNWEALAEQLPDDAPRERVNIIEAKIIEALGFDPSVTSTGDKE